MWPAVQNVGSIEVVKLFSVPAAAHTGQDEPAHYLFIPTPAVRPRLVVVDPNVAPERAQDLIRFDRRRFRVNKDRSPGESRPIHANLLPSF